MSKDLELLKQSEFEAAADYGRMTHELIFMQEKHKDVFAEFQQLQEKVKNSFLKLCQLREVLTAENTKNLEQIKKFSEKLPVKEDLVPEEQHSAK